MRRTHSAPQEIMTGEKGQDWELKPFMACKNEPGMLPSEATRRKAIIKGFNDAPFEVGNVARGEKPSGG